MQLAVALAISGNGGEWRELRGKGKGESGAVIARSGGVATRAS